MMNFDMKNERTIDLNSLEALYNDVGWSAYTKDLPLLQQALTQSLAVFSVWADDKLLGLIRIVGDGLTIIYIQDILVLTAYQNKGIASKLMQHTLEVYKEVRQKVLLTEDAANVRHFYEKHGFSSCDQGDAVAFAIQG